MNVTKSNEMIIIEVYQDFRAFISKEFQFPERRMEI